MPLFKPYAIEAYKIVRAHHGLPPLDTALNPSPYNPSASSPSESTALTPPSTPQRSISSGGYTPPTPPMESGYLPLFNQYIAQQHKFVEWVFTTASPADPMGTRTNPIRIDMKALKRSAKTTPIWHVKAMLDGECVGRGKARTKKGAKNEAARKALIKLGVEVVSACFPCS
jgi:ribonuclease III